MIKKTPLYLLLAIAVLFSTSASFTSCKKDKDDDDDTFTYSSSTQTTLVTGFSLQADAEVLASLDSVHFTIDYDRGLIYNADSLPVGTKVTGLKVKVNFLNNVSSAVFSITGATQQADTTIEYTASMSQKLDFTGQTMLKVTSADGLQEKNYEVKVLVHKVNPDSLVWPVEWQRQLPGFSEGAMGCKVVEHDGQYLIMMYDGMACQLLTASSISQITWEKQSFIPPFTPQVSTLTATDKELYVLSTDGALYCSPDGLEWTSCGVTWHSLLGAYGDRVLGIMKGDDGYYHDEYPRSEGFTATHVEDGFPVSNSSGMIETDNSWTVSQQAMIVGGIDANGNLLADVWGYDGQRWGKINNIHSQTLPAIADATLVPYFTYRRLAGVRRYAIQPTWYVMGGRLGNGSLNDDIYLSSTQGITWSKADSTIAFPSYVPEFYGAQAIVSVESMTASGASYLPRRIQSPVTSWDCPFIYLIGGYDAQGELIPYVWRGVFNRMTNYPVY